MSTYTTCEANAAAGNRLLKHSGRYYDLYMEARSRGDRDRARMYLDKSVNMSHRLSGWATYLIKHCEVK